MLQDLWLYLAGGAVAGLLAGLFGVGGGTILVPVLLVLFAHAGVEPALWMHLALGTSLAVIILNATSSVRAHQKRGGVMWPVFWRMTPGVVAGGLIGSAIAAWLSSATLAAVFAVFLVVVGLQMLFGAQPRAQRQVPGARGLALAGGVIGAVSAIVGIGGGSLTVPFLIWCNARVSSAVATSAAVGLPIAIAGAAGYVISGWGTLGLPPHSLGFVYLPAFVGMALAGMALAPVGARLAHALPAQRLKQIFGVFLLLVAARMIWKVI